MKRIVSVSLLFFMMIGICSGAAADTFDMSALRTNEYLDIDVDTDSGVAFVESILTANDLSFTHSNESNTQYSYSRFDMLVINYFKTTAYPVLRLWLTVSTEGEYFYFTSATITVNDKRFTFSDIADKDWFEKKESSYSQDMLIKFGVDNLEFLAEVEKVVNACESVDDLEAVRLPIVFHGTKDIEAKLSVGFFLEFIVFKNAMLVSNGFDFLDKASASAMKVTTVN